MMTNPIKVWVVKFQVQVMICSHVASSDLDLQYVASTCVMINGLFS